MNYAHQEAAALLSRARTEISRIIVGQDRMIDRILVALLAGGHCLLEGVPGLGKTKTLSTLARVMGGTFSRIQFTPDLLPSDLIGTLVFVPAEQRFEVHKGPLFSPVVLADEINRAPAKVQSALLEAMEERQVTIGDETFALPDPFLVMATQNPIDLEGTYALPEAQIDRFLLKVLAHYPSAAEEREVVARDGRGFPSVRPVADRIRIAALREATARVHVADPVRSYAVELVRATRDPALAGARLQRPEARAAAGCLAVGASPRASLFLVRAARARAVLEGRGFATPHDVKRMAAPVLRHRLILSYEAEAEGVEVEHVLEALLAAVETP